MERVGIQRFLYNIWPTIYRVVNNTFFATLKFLKNLARLMIAQVKHG